MFEKLTKTLKRFQENARTWFETHGSKLLLSLGIAAVLALAFEGGFLLGRDQRSDPLVITLPAASCAPVSTADSTNEALPVKNPISAASLSQNAAQSARNASPGDAGGSNNESCAFVGSKNSDKYHLPKCSWAKRIKPENRVCFTSAADAEAKGYKAGCVR